MRVLFIGTGEIGVPVLRWLIASPEHELVGVVTQPDRPVGRSQRVEAPPIKAALGPVAIPILQPERIKSESAIAEIRALAPEAIVVMAYGQILPRAVLEIPPVACLNLHASLLPKYRGAAPIQAAIAAGDRETGITVMYMDVGLDTGDILLESKLGIGPKETGGALHDRLGEIAPTALAEALDRLAHGNAPRVPQRNEEASHAPKLEREHGRIDWSDGADAIERKIRALNPWPGCFAILHDVDGRELKLKIFTASVTDARPLAIGKIATSQDEGLLVGLSDGALRLEDVQLEGKKRMSAADLLRGHPWIGSASIVTAS